MAITRIVSQDIKDLTVATGDIADGAITLAKHANDSVDLTKLACLTTKGDLLTFDTDHARLGVGTNGFVLTADSAQTTGIKWAAVTGTGTVTSITGGVGIDPDTAITTVGTLDLNISTLTTETVPVSGDWFAMHDISISASAASAGRKVSLADLTTAVMLEASVGHIVNNETPTGTVDGSNAAFVLGATPLAGSQMIYKNGIRQKPGAGNDYTISTNTITFLSGNIPQTGDVILADYRK